MSVRVLVADDQEMVRAGFRRLLESEAGIEVVGEAADGIEACESARRVKPDIVLMDIRMPRLDGIAATRRVIASAPATRVLILTTYDLDRYVYAALRAGASGFLLKDAPAADLVDGVRIVARGDALLAPSITRRLIREFARRPDPEAGPAELAELTTRESEVLALVARGLSNAEIASDLVVAEATVKSHVGGILTKLGLRDRVQAVVLAYEAGLVRPGEHTLRSAPPARRAALAPPPHGRAAALHPCATPIRTIKKAAARGRPDPRHRRAPVRTDTSSQRAAAPSDECGS
jgi:DNA-binding NarL/FixJ family response regulator